MKFEEHFTPSGKLMLTPNEFLFMKDEARAIAKETGLAYTGALQYVTDRTVMEVRDGK